MSNKILQAIKDPKYAFEYLIHKGKFTNMSDEKYLKMMFKHMVGYKLNLDNPQTFNEKLQWLKLYDRNPLYTQLVDKYEVRKYITENIGEEYLIPLIGVWDKFGDIDFGKLPNQFVLKCTHDSGGLVICKDKSKLDIKASREKINKSLKRNYYYSCREWPYKNVKPRIICEKLIDENIKDYKFYCFNGEPKYLYVSQGLENHATAKISFYDMNFHVAPFWRNDYKPFDKEPNKPQKFEEMKEIARKLSENLPFIRVDLYNIGGRIYFSELTLTPCAGFMPFQPQEYDEVLGKILII